MTLVALLLAVAPGGSLPTVPERIVEGARKQLAWGTVYDNAYYRIPYPNGDLPKTKGVCTDVVIRALRHAGFDLQRLIHEDMKLAWKAYPRYAGLNKPDRNIDHRRVPNQRVFWKRHGLVLTTDPNNKRAWKPGDIVTWKLDNGLDHTGVLTDQLNRKGLPYVVHNLGTTLEEDVLEAWKITGHYRYPR